jgi:hypothetical protein
MEGILFSSHRDPAAHPGRNIQVHGLWPGEVHPIARTGCHPEGAPGGGRHAAMAGGQGNDSRRFLGGRAGSKCHVPAEISATGRRPVSFQHDSRLGLGGKFCPGDTVFCLTIRAFSEMLQSFGGKDQEAVFLGSVQFESQLGSGG